MPLSLGSTAALVDRLAGRSDSAALTAAVRAVSVIFVAALTAAAAQVSIPLPFTAVPFTFGPTVVLVAGLALGPRLAMASQVLYIAAGVAGLPVFAASPLLPPGAARLLGPTGGYLMAYPIAAYVTGYLGSRGRDRRYLASLGAMLAGLGVIFTGGVLWLSMLVGVPAALAVGFYPFVVADVFKLMLAAGVLPAVWKLLGR